MFGNTSFSFGNTSNAFGSNNNNKSMFGNNNNNSSGFGSTGFGNSSGTAFGSTGFGNNNNSSSAFGTSSGFGSSTFGNSSGFGTNNNTSAFGSTGFGNTSSFNRNSSSFGGFGSNNNTSAFGSSTAFGSNTSSAFGTSGFGNSSSSAFGKSAFGGGTSAFGSSMSAFGSNNNNNSSAFGSNFGSSNNSSFGGFGNSGNSTQNNGTGNPKYQQTIEKDGSSYQSVTFNSISAMPAYRNFSFEELRVKDYMMGKKGPSMGMGGSSMFGSSTSAFGGMNNQRSAFGNNTSAFGNTGFGSSMNNNNNTFGSSAFGQSAFGNNNNNQTSTFGGFGSNNNNNNNSFGFGNNNNNNNNNSVFGNSGFGNTGFGNNNNNTGNSVFGQSSFGSNTNTFGSNVSAFGSSNNKPFGSTGFGNNNNNNNAFGSSGFGNQNTGFGMNNNNNNNNAFGSTAFGQNNSNSSFSSGFKLNNNNTNSTFGSTGFGQNNNTMNNNQNSVFGNNTNNNSTGFFGQSNTANNNTTNSFFGNNNNMNGNNNSNTTASSGFGFKTTTGFGTSNSNTNTGNTTGMFGTSNSLFGNKTGFGTTSTQAPTTSTAASTTTSTFGFGNTNTTKPTTTTTSLFGNTNTQAKTTFGFGSTAPATTVTTTPLSTTTTSTTGLFKSNTSNNTFSTAVPSTASNNKEPVTTKTNTTTKQEPQITPIIEKNKPVKRNIKPKGVIRKINPKMKIREYNHNDQESDSEISESEQSIDNNVTSKKKNNKISKDIQKLLDEYEKELKENKIKEEVSFNEINEKTEKLKIVENHEQKHNVKIKETNNEINKIKDQKVSQLNESTVIEKEKIADEDSIKQISNIKRNIKRATKNNQYEVNPPVSKLIEMTEEELRCVKDLEIYVKNIGSLKFLEPVDLLSACNGKKRENIPYIFGNIIILQPKSCTVYPDDRVKPEVGQGLNHPAIIELYGCWAKDKSTGKPIMDPNLPAYKKHILNLKKVEDTEFIDYEALQGKWTFKVEHFTRYGLFTDDEDDDDFEELVLNGKKELKLKNKTDGKINRGYGLISTDDESSENEVKNLNAALNKQIDKNIVVSEVLSEDDIKEKNKLDSMKYCFNMMENAKKLQVMNVSIFGSYKNEGNHSILKTINYSENIIPLKKTRMAKRLEKLNSLRNLDNDYVMPSQSKVNMQILNRFKKNFEENKKLINATINNSGAPILSLKSNSKNNMKKLEKEMSILSNISTEDLDKLSIAQNNLENIPLYNQSIFNNMFSNNNNGHEDRKKFNLLMSRSFRIGWGKNNEIAIPSVTSLSYGLPYDKVELGTVDTYKILFAEEKEKHIPLLSALLQSSKIRHEFDSMNEDISEEIENADCIITNPVIVREPSQKTFTNLLNIIKPSINTTFYRTEILMYKLCQILFDADDMSEMEEYEGMYNKSKRQYIIDMQKKQNIGKWLKDSLTDSVKVSLEILSADLDDLKTNDNAETEEVRSLIMKLIFINLSGGMTINACKEAVNNNEYRLSTLISQLAICNENIGEKKTITRGVPGSGKTNTEYMNMIKRQIELNEKEEEINNTTNIYNDIFKLLSGQIDVSLCKDLVDWKQVLGLIFWYKDGGSLSFPEALNIFDDLMEQVKTEIPQNSMNMNLFNYTEDIIYYLFKFYAHNDFPRAKILLPKNYSDSNLDYRISWILNQLLPPTQGFSDDDQIKLNNKITHSYIFQLESIGCWEWACFVAMHLNDPIEREKVIKRLLIQNFPLDSNDDSVSSMFFSIHLSNWNPEINNDGVNENVYFCLNPNKNYTNLWHFLVDKLQIPKLWIHDAKRIKAIYKGDILREVFYTMDCEQWEKAHMLIVEKLASNLIIHNKYELLYELLKVLSQKLEIKDNTNANWIINGGLYLDFIRFNEDFSHLLENRKYLLKSLYHYQNGRFNLIDNQSQFNFQQVNSLLSINSDENTFGSTGSYSNSLQNIYGSIYEIDQFLERISILLKKISLKKKLLNKNKDSISKNDKKIIKGLEIIEEHLMTAYYVCNDTRLKQKKQISSYEDDSVVLLKRRDESDEFDQNEDENDEFNTESEENEENKNENYVVADISNPMLSYQLLSDTSLNENKRSLMIDRLTDKWFNTVLDI